LGLKAAGLRAQVKGAFSVLEFAQQHGRLSGPSHILAPLIWLKNGHRRQNFALESGECGSSPPDAHTLMINCDMGRVTQAPSLAALALHGLLPKGAIVCRRQRHFRAYDSAFAQPWARAHGVLPLATDLQDGAAPYVYPLWVDSGAKADALYTQLRLARLPVFRWDRIWPGTPADSQDSGATWSHQVLQLLCHQDLRREDLDQVIGCIRLFLQAV
jgi:hypothetical protein